MLEMVMVTDKGVIGDEDVVIEKGAQKNQYMTSCKCVIDPKMDSQ